jgi:hypothetical protein
MKRCQWVTVPWNFYGMETFAFKGWEVQGKFLVKTRKANLAREHNVLDTSVLKLCESDRVLSREYISTKLFANSLSKITKRHLRSTGR